MKYEYAVSVVGRELGVYVVDSFISANLILNQNGIFTLYTIYYLQAECYYTASHIAMSEQAFSDRFTSPVLLPEFPLLSNHLLTTSFLKSLLAIMSFTEPTMALFVATAKIVLSALKPFFENFDSNVFAEPKCL